MTPSWIWGLAVLLALSNGPAVAQLRAPNTSSLSLGAQDLTLDLAPNVGLRGWVGGRHGVLASDGLQASSMVLADWYPLSHGLRLSGGLALGGARWDTSFTSPALRDFGSVGTGDPRTWLTRGSPYVGLGWDLGATSKSGLYLSADLGLMYQRSSLATWGCPSGLPIGVCGPEARGFTSQADESRLAPMMSLGVGLRF